MTQRGPRSWRDFLAALALLLLVTAGRPASATVRYQVSFENRQKHIFAVEMTIPNAVPGTRVALPAWEALYQIRDFSYRVRQVQAWSSAGGVKTNQALVVTKLDKQTWQLSGSRDDAAGDATASIVVRYTIEWDDPGPFSSQINNHHAFLNLAEVLMYVPDRRGEDTVVLFSGVPQGWKTIAALPAGTEANSFAAASYDALVDAPVEAGKFDEFEFDSGGVHFRVVVDSRDCRKGTLENALKRITGYQLQLMGGLSTKEYTFIFHIGPFPETGAGGGMEHLNSTAIATSSLESAVGVAAHEFFHAWNVKRIRPQALEPVDFTKEQYTRALWFAEGVTNTYQNYTLERTGLWSKETFLTDLGDQVCDLEARSARLWQSVEESSMDAWFEKYDFYNRPDRSIWYYNKGQILGVLLDLKIRDVTNNRKSLDDVFRLMDQKYARQGKFYDDRNGIREAVEEVAGASFQDFLQAYVSGTNEIPYDTFLAAGGWALKTEQVESADFGFWPTRTLGGMMVAAIESGSAAESAGVKEGDVLVELDGQPFPRRFNTWLSEQAPGQRVKVRLRREGDKKEISFALGSHSDRHCSIYEIPHPTEAQRRVRDGLLHGTTDSSPQ
ncbi:MAG: M61 family metallopeptidase [Candidatus Acidiferrales bacterium]